jgi:hypothetical protein
VDECHCEGGVEEGRRSLTGVSGLEMGAFGRFDLERLRWEGLVVE